MSRLIKPYILKDLKTKMVFLGGPRQSGKTYLAKELLQDFKSDKNYFNWDSTADKKSILAQNWSSQPLVVLDEVHKYPQWKNFVKGTYDTQKNDHTFLVTGSARLDLYKRGGDSMVGRYHYWRLHPFTLDEVPTKMPKLECFNRLLEVGGFPEPFLNPDTNFARRWRKERQDLIIREDIRDLEKINEIQNIGLLLELLKERVGSLIVVANLAADLQVAPNTVKRWITILEKMYLVFCVRPYTNKLSRSISKPFKIYFYDNADVIGGEGAKYENLVATHLLKKIQFKEDSEGYRYQLYFIRDKEGREVDFAITKDRQLIFLIEAKWSDSDLSKNLIYYAEKLQPENAVQLVAKLKREYSKNKLHVLDAIEHLTHGLKL